jgi:hypothetical protein
MKNWGKSWYKLLHWEFKIFEIKKYPLYIFCHNYEAFCWQLGAKIFFETKSSDPEMGIAFFIFKFYIEFGIKTYKNETRN